MCWSARFSVVFSLFLSGCVLHARYSESGQRGDAEKTQALTADDIIEKRYAVKPEASGSMIAGGILVGVLTVGIVPVIPLVVDILALPGSAIRKTPPFKIVRTMYCDRCSAPAFEFLRGYHEAERPSEVIAAWRKMDLRASSTRGRGGKTKTNYPYMDYKRNAKATKEARANLQRDFPALLQAWDQLALMLADYARHADEERRVCESARKRRDPEQLFRCSELTLPPSAQRRMRTLSEHRAWELLQRQGEPATYDWYIAHHPKGPNNAAVRAFGHDLFLGLARQRPCTETWQAYLNRFPKGSEVKEARRQLNEFRCVDLLASQNSTTARDHLQYLDTESKCRPKLAAHTLRLEEDALHDGYLACNRAAAVKAWSVAAPDRHREAAQLEAERLSRADALLQDGWQSLQPRLSGSPTNRWIALSQLIEACDSLESANPRCTEAVARLKRVTSSLALAKCELELDKIAKHFKAELKNYATSKATCAAIEPAARRGFRKAGASHPEELADLACFTVLTTAAVSQAEDKERAFWEEVGREVGAQIVEGLTDGKWDGDAVVGAVIATVKSWDSRERYKACKARAQDDPLEVLEFKLSSAVRRWYRTGDFPYPDCPSSSEPRSLPEPAADQGSRWRKSL